MDSKYALTYSANPSCQFLSGTSITQLYIELSSPVSEIQKKNSTLRITALSSTERYLYFYRLNCSSGQNIETFVDPLVSINQLPCYYSENS
jgi:hypothetical protein